MKKLLNVNLALFDGESAGGATPGATVSGEGAMPQTNAANTRKSAKRGKSGDYSNVVFGKQPATADDANNPSAAGKSDAQDAGASNTREARRKAYDEFIKGEGKEFYTEDTQAMINKRFAESKKTIGELEAHKQQTQPILDALMQRYNVTDIAGLQKAIDNDNDYWTKAAEEAGMDVQAFKNYKKMELERAALLKAEQYRNNAQKAQEQLKKWDDEAKALQEKFPNFDLSVEVQNSDFLSLIERKVPMEQAYRLIHMDELMSDAVQTATATTEKKVVDNLRAKGARPAENGTASHSAFTVKDDVTKLTRADRAEIARQAARGKKIMF